jgi:hypothetical protein
MVSMAKRMARYLDPQMRYTAPKAATSLAVFGACSGEDDGVLMEEKMRGA